MCFLSFFCVLFVCLFVSIFCVFFFVVLYCIFCIFNITMKFQDASCPSLAVGVLSPSVEIPSQSLVVSESYLNARFDRATFPFSIAQISSFELSSA